MLGSSRETVRIGYGIGLCTAEREAKRVGEARAEPWFAGRLALPERQSDRGCAPAAGSGAV